MRKTRSESVSPIFVLSVTWITALLIAEVTSAQRVDRIEQLPARKLAHLKHREVAESSGLACSHRTDGVFWTHNDSGDRPRIFAFDTTGAHRGTVLIDGARARDWEDMASFVLDETPCLLLADTGDNLFRKSHYTLYLAEEPEIGDKPPRDDLRVPLLQKVVFSYEDGSHNAEAVAFDPVEKMVIVATKETDAGCNCYAFSWPTESNSKKNRITARKIATTTFPLATAMDITGDGRRAVIATYGLAFEFNRAPGESWGQVLSQDGRPLVTPFRRQGETICYGREGAAIYLTSEGRPTPLFEIRLDRQRESQ